MVGKTPFHHYVPRFYLEGFTDLSLKQGDRPMHSIWLYRRNKMPRYVSIRKVGGEQGFYAHEQGDFEGQLSRWENTWAILLEKLINDKRLYGKDRMEFARCMGLMSSRGPYFYDMVSTLAVHAEEYIRLRARDAEEAKALRQQLTALNLLSEPVTRKWTLTEMIDAGSDFAKLYDRMNWVVVRARSSDDYAVSCDTPVALTDHGPKFTTTGLGFSENVDMTFPLDRHHILWGTIKRREGTQAERGYAFRQINKRMVRRAFNSVYAPVRSTGLAGLVKDQLRQETFSIDQQRMFADLDEVRRMWG